jgi:pimeloyl-ACP methyl ester carboxylesterase
VTDTLTIAGLKTSLVRAGKGEPLILLHGLGASNYSWRYTVPELAKHYEVFAPDLPTTRSTGCTPGSSRSWIISA